jgi:LPS sulfotransferase NodH
MSINENLLKGIPEMNFKENNALVILTTQRSGSAMLCEDISKLGVFGTPNEHFVDIYYKLKGKTGKELWDHFSSNGNLYNSDYYSVKLMFNYLPEFGYWISDRTILGSSKNNEINRELSIKFFLEKFKNVTFIYLKRKNKFEQAVSHYKAIKTNIWHKITNTAHGSPEEERQLLDHIDVELFDTLYDSACNEDRDLESLLNKLGIDYLPFVYEEIKNDYPNYLLKLSAKTGVEINIDSLDIRKNQKIVSNDFVLNFKKSLIGKTKRIYTC